MGNPGGVISYLLKTEPGNSENRLLCLVQCWHPAHTDSTESIGACCGLIVAALVRARMTRQKDNAQDDGATWEGDKAADMGGMKVIQRQLSGIWSAAADAGARKPLRHRAPFAASSL